MFKKMPHSTKKFIRSEKARIRRQFFDPKKQQELIKDLYNKISGKIPESVSVKKEEVANAKEVVKEKMDKKEIKKIKKTDKKNESKKKK